MNMNSHYVSSLASLVIIEHEQSLSFIVGNLLEEDGNPTEGHGCEVDNQESTWKKIRKKRIGDYNTLYTEKRRYKNM